jgi:hypothetical protein
MKQIAVEWLQDTWLNYPDLCSYDKIQEWFEKAKQMEKEQMQDLFKAGVNYGSGYVIATEWGEETTEPDFENYYNRTFKSE